MPRPSIYAPPPTRRKVCINFEKEKFRSLRKLDRCRPDCRKITVLTELPTAKLLVRVLLFCHAKCCSTRAEIYHVEGICKMKYFLKQSVKLFHSLLVDRIFFYHVIQQSSILIVSITFSDQTEYFTFIWLFYSRS